MCSVPKICKHSRFRRGEMAARDVERLRYIVEFLKVDPHRAGEPHRQYTTISTMGQTEMEARCFKWRNQSRLAMPAACEDKLRRIDDVRILGKNPPCNCVRLNEVHAKPVIRETNRARGFVTIENGAVLRHNVFVFDEARQPNMDLAVA